jgi:hypothetical protein
MKMFMRMLHILHENVYEIVIYSCLMNSAYENVHENVTSYENVYEIVTYSGLINSNYENVYKNVTYYENVYDNVTYII